MALRVGLPLNGTLENKGISGPVTQTTAPTYVNGKIGKAMSTGAFYIPAAEAAKFYNNEAMSFCFGIYPIGTENSGIILGQSAMAAGDNRMFSIFQYPTPNDLHLSWQIETATNTTFFSCVINGIFTADTGTHCAITYNGSQVLIYKNGTLLNTYACSKSTRTNFSYNVPTPSLSIRYLNDLRVYDHCLSPKEVKEISQGLVLHYKLDGFNGGANENLTPCGGTYTKTSPGTTTKTAADGGAFITNSAFEAKPSATYTISVECDGTLSNRHAAGDIPIANKPGSFGVYVCNTDTTKSGTTGGYDRAINLTSANNNYRKIGNRHVGTITLSSTEKYLSLRTNSYSDGSTSVTINGGNIKVEEGSEMTAGTLPSTIGGIDTTKIIDSSGYGNDGTIVGELSIESGSSRYASAIHIGSTSSKIHILNFPTAGFGNSYTFAGGAKVSSVNPMHGGFSDGIRLNGMYTGRLGNTGDGSNNPLYIPGTTTQVAAPTVNVGHHWAMTGDGTSCKVYQDGIYGGVAKTYKSISGTSIYINGGNSGTDYCSDNLSISDFRIYATALSAEDILDLYHTPANIDNLQNIHTFELKDNENTSQILKNGIMATKEFHESNSELLNSFSSGGYAPAKNANNSCVNMGIADFSDYADLNKDLSIHIECDIEGTAFTADTGGTFKGIGWQGSNYKKETSAYAWEGANYVCSILNSTKSLQNVTTVASPGKYHYDVITTIPASGFNTYSKSNIGFRCDYSDGTGRIDVTNFKITPSQYYNAKIGKDFISASNFIEK